MASASFGYGIFRLCTSLLPATWLKFVHVLGLKGDRFEGLEALMFTRKSDDMRAPLATLALLLYHTFIKPYFALEGSGAMKNGIEAAHLLLEETQESYGQSTLFIFFKGRVYRMQGDAHSALSAYRTVMQQSKQRELRLMALHEIAWCHLLLLNWPHALAAFASLRRESRWCKSFYAYMAAICAGAEGKIDESLDGLSQVVALASTGGRSLEDFLIMRSTKLEVERNSVTRSFFLLRLYEVLYLWNSLCFCPQDSLHSILKECQSMVGDIDAQMHGLHHLILGHIYSCLEDKGNALKILKESVKVNDSTFIKAYCSYEIGCILLQEQLTEVEGRRYLQEAKAFKEFPFEGRLAVKIDAVLLNESS